MTTKADFVSALATASGQSKTATDAVLSALADAVIAVAKQGDSIVIPGLGKFEGKAREARTARNPFNGKAIKVPAQTVLAFKVSTTAKAAMKEAKAKKAPAKAEKPAKSEKPAKTPAKAEKKTAKKVEKKADKAAAKPAAKTPAKKARK